MVFLLVGAISLITFVQAEIFFQTASSNIMSNEGKINNNCFKLYNYVDVQLYAGALTVIVCSDF